MSLLLSDPVKLSIISITGIVLFTGISAVSLAFYNQKKYPPFKAKQLPAVALSLLSSCFWLLGTLQSLAVFNLTTPVWSNCAFWEIWY